MDIQDAVDNYTTAMRHCYNLITVHRAAGPGGRGRRIAEPSINRGTVVLTVAAWQAFIQDLAEAMRDAVLAELKAAPGPFLLLGGAMDAWKHDFDQAHEKYSTPNSEKSRELLKRTGFDPRPSWTWHQKGGRGMPPVLVEPKHVDEVIKQWLRVRHDVAHGHSTISAVAVLTAVRDSKASPKAKASPTLRLTDAIDCVRFFRTLVALTADAAAVHIQVPAPTWENRPRPALGLHISSL